jgi:hypothetical protein
MIGPQTLSTRRSTRQVMGYPPPKTRRESPPPVGHFWLGYGWPIARRRFDTPVDITNGT